MGWFLPFLVVVGTGIIAGLIIYILILITKQVEIKENKDLGINFADNEEGRMIGKVNSIDEKETGTSLVTLEPIDLSPKSIKKGVHKKPISFLVGKGKIGSIPKGKGSKDKNIHFFLPETADELNPEIRNTTFGKMLAFGIELGNADETVVKCLREGIDRRDMILQNMGDGEVSRTEFERMKGLLKDIDDIYKDAKRDKSPTSIV